MATAATHCPVLVVHLHIPHTHKPALPVHKRQTKLQPAAAEEEEETTTSALNNHQDDEREPDEKDVIRSAKASVNSTVCPPT